jgi:CO/xanthine dehydrogenase FAD-binding subunit
MARADIEATAMIEDYQRPRTVEETLRMLEKASGQTRIIAGGTDLLLEQGKDLSHAVCLIDICDIPDLVGITSAEDGLSIGAATRLDEIVKSPLLKDSLHVLSVGAATVGSPQIRNRATLGGNVCNASPSADTVPPLLVMDAQVTLVSRREVRTVPLTEFFVGPGSTVLRADELMLMIFVPYPPPRASTVYLKHAPRRAMDLAIASVAVSTWYAGGRVQARIAMGAVAPTPRRSTQAETLLASSSNLDDTTLRAVAACAAGETSPISDVRATAGYRKAMIEALTFQALRQAIDGLAPH